MQSSNLSDTLEDLLIYDDLFFEYFSCFNALPIFAQPLEYHRLTGAFRLKSCCGGSRTTKTQTPAFGLNDNERESMLDWAKQTRLPFFVQSELYRELKLCKLLLLPTDLAGSATQKSGNLTTPSHTGITTSSENEFEYDGDEENAYATNEIYDDEGSEVPSRAISLPAYLDQFRPTPSSLSDKAGRSSKSKGKTPETGSQMKSDKRKSIGDDDRSSRSGVLSAPLNYEDYMKLPLHKLLSEYVAAGEDEELEYDSNGQKRKPYVSFAEDDSSHKKHRKSKSSSTHSATTTSGSHKRGATTTEDDEINQDFDVDKGGRASEQQRKHMFETQSTVLIDPESEVMYYDAEHRSESRKSRGSLTTSASSQQSGQESTADDMRGLENKHKVSYNRLKELMIGKREGFHEFIRFISETEGSFAIRFWFDCETYKDAVSMIDIRSDSHESVAMRNQLYKNIQSRYNMRLSEPAKAEIRRASQTNNVHAMNAVFVRVQHDVLKRIRSYWLPRFIIHKEYQISRHSFAELSTLSATNSMSWDREKTQIHIHIVSSSSSSRERIVHRQSTHSLRQFVIENAFSLLHIHAYQHSLSFLLELLHSVPNLKATNRDGHGSKQQLSSAVTLENLVAQAQLYDVLLLSLAIDRACGKPFMNYLVRLAETDIDRAVCESLINCAMLVQDLIDYTVNESPYSESLISQAVCSGVGPATMFVLRREYLNYLQSKFLVATASNCLDLPELVRDQLLQLFRFVSVNGVTAGRSETALRSNQIIILLVQFCFDKLWKYWLRYLQEDELEFLRWAPNPRKTELSTKQVTFSEVERSQDTYSTMAPEASDIVRVMVTDLEYFEVEIMHDEHLIIKRKNISIPPPEVKVPISAAEREKRRKRRLEVEYLCKLAIKNAQLRRRGLLDRKDDSQAITPLTEDMTNRDGSQAGEQTQTSMHSEDEQDDKFEASAIGQPGIPEFREVFNSKHIMRLFNKYLFDKQIKDIATFVFFYIDLSDYFALTAGEKGKSRRDFQAKLISRTYFEKVSKRYVELPDQKLSSRVDKEFGRPSTPLLKDIFTLLNEQITPVFRDFWDYEVKEKGVDMFALKNMSEKEFAMRQEEDNTANRLKNAKAEGAPPPPKPRLTPEQFLKTLVHPPNQYIWRGRKGLFAEEITRRDSDAPSQSAMLQEFVKHTPMARLSPKRLTVKLVREGTGKQPASRDDKFDLLALLDQCVSGGQIPLKAFYFYKYLLKFGPVNNQPVIDRDLFFYVEVQKFKEHSHAHADLELLKRKVQSICDSFLDCLNPPPIQITVSPEMQQRIMKAAQRFASGREVVPGLFDEAQFQVFKDILPYYAGFNRDWSDSTTTQEKLTDMILPYTRELQDRREKFEKWQDPGVRAFQLPKPPPSPKKQYLTPAQLNQLAAQYGHAAAVAAAKAQSQQRVVTVTFSLSGGVTVKDREKEQTQTPGQPSNDATPNVAAPKPSAAQA